LTEEKSGAVMGIEHINPPGRGARVQAEERDDELPRLPTSSAARVRAVMGTP
jgi:hypothetical protein